MKVILSLFLFHIVSFLFSIAFFSQNMLEQKNVSFTRPVKPQTQTKDGIYIVFVITENYFYNRYSEDNKEECMHCMRTMQVLTISQSFGIRRLINATATQLRVSNK